MTTDDDSSAGRSVPAVHGPFCAACGTQMAAGDRFCRACGAAVVPVEATSRDEPEVATPADAETAEMPTNDLPVDGVRDSSVPDESGAHDAAGAETVGQARAGSRDDGNGAGSNRGVVGLVAAALVVMAVSAVGVVLALGGGGESDAEKAALANRQALKVPFDELMQERDALFAVERQYRAAMKATNRDLTRYRSSLARFKRETKRIDDEFAAAYEACGRLDIPCPNPTYPDAPSAPNVSDERATLRKASSDLQELRARLNGISPTTPLAVLHNQLLAATESLKETADHNADVLSEAITPAQGEDESSDVDLGKLGTLRTEQAIPAIVAGNRAAVQLIRKMRLNIAEYDVPGGRDLDTHDNSVTTAA